MAFKEDGYTEFFEKDGKPWKRTWRHCWRCSGRGVILPFMHVANGVCFKCMDHKGYWEERRVLTEKEQERREKAKVRKAAKRESERAGKLEGWKQERMEKIGFKNGSIHVVAMEDTFSIKDELKAAGARFNGAYGWFFEVPTDAYPTVEITAEEGLEFHEDALPNESPEAMTIIKSRIWAQSPKPQSEWIGQIGDKVEMELTFKRETSFDSMYGTKWIMIFEDENENVFKWSTTKAVIIEKEQRVQLKGTIKDHTEYRDVKQTELTRCKIQVLE